MTRELESHQTKTEMIQSAPPEVDAGADVPLRVKVSCPSACDLRGKTVRIIAQDATVLKEVALASFEEEINQTDQLALEAPTELGEHAWSVVFPAQEVGGILHEASSTPMVFNVKPHSTSIAVWDIPAPIQFNDKFKIKVGVKCSAGCDLMDNEVRVYGQRGKKVATAALGGVPWRGTSALYWAEVELEAPGLEGYHRWRVKFPKPDLELPHEGVAYSFAFVTARQPEHTVTVEVIDTDTKAPIKGADVVLHPYRARTDEGGVARVRVPKGEYKLYVSTHDYVPLETTAEVGGDATIKAELLFWPDARKR